MRFVLCPTCGTKTSTSTQRVYGSPAAEVIASHWDQSGAPCPTSFAPADDDLESFIPDAAPEAPSIPEMANQIQSLLDAVNQLILDSLEV